jgi:hypothetical protein
MKLVSGIAKFRGERHTELIEWEAAMCVWRTISVLFVFALAVTGCSSSSERAQKSAYKAQESVSQERLKLVDKYQKCVKDAGADKQAVEDCDTYLRAAESLK